MSRTTTPRPSTTPKPKSGPSPKASPSSKRAPAEKATWRSRANPPSSPSRSTPWREAAAAVTAANPKSAAKATKAAQAEPQGSKGTKRKSTARGGRQNRETPKRRRELEAPEQQVVVRALIGAGLLFNAQHNGLHLSKPQAAEAVRMGTQKGCPDLVIFTPPPAFKDEKTYDEEGNLIRIGRVGTALEMKIPSKAPKTKRAGKYSGTEPHQREWLEKMEGEGWHCIVGYGALDAMCKLEEAGYNIVVPRWMR